MFCLLDGSVELLISKHDFHTPDPFQIITTQQNLPWRRCARLAGWQTMEALKELTYLFFAMSHDF